MVRAHLRPRGRFLFDVRHPDPVELARDPQRVYKGRPVTRRGRRIVFIEAEMTNDDGKVVARGRQTAVPLSSS